MTLLYFFTQQCVLSSSRILRHGDPLIFLGGIFVRHTGPALAYFRVFTAVLLYCCCTTIVHIAGSWGVDGCFFLLCAVLYYYCCTTYCCCSTGWLGGSVRGCVHGFVDNLFYYFFSSYTGPALAWFSVPLLQIIMLLIEGGAPVILLI